MARLTLVIGLTAALGAAVLLPRAARACSCLPVRPPNEALEQAAAVFEGRTFKHEEVDGRIRYTFEVTRYWKGDVGRQVEIETAPNSAMCGRSFSEGMTYLVYAREVDGSLRDNMCSRTRTGEQAGEDFEVLGKAMTPGEPPPAATPTEPPRIDPTPPPDTDAPPATPPGKRGCAVGQDAPTWAALLPAGAMLLRRRRVRARRR